ncbi:MAG: DUF6069 family protein [Ilumatobacter sp.]
MLKAALFGTLAALVAVVATFLIGDAVSGPLLVTSPGADAPEELEIGAALIATVFGAVVGLGLAALCRRLLSAGAAVFAGICVVGLIGYGIFSFSASEEVATGVWLNAMHIAAAIPIVGALVRQFDTNADASSMTGRG